VFEHGLGSDLTVWTKVQQQLLGGLSTFAYSRPGFGESELIKGSRSPLEVAKALYDTLRELGVPGPFLLVGHSSGGLYVRMFASLYPEEVLGLVLVDPSHERQAREIMGDDPGSLAKLSEIPSDTSEPIRRELSGLIPVLSSGILLVDGKVPDVPMVVLTSTAIPAGAKDFDKTISKIRRLHDELLFSSSDSMHVVTAHCRHFIQVDRPDLVAEAIRWVASEAEKYKR